MRRLIFLGNCVAERLASLLAGLLNSPWAQRYGLPRDIQVVPCSPVYWHKNDPKKLGEMGRIIEKCELVFSQPLFRFASLNTEELSHKLGERLHIFSAPNFEAYFPDVMDIRPYKEKEKFPHPLEWHSSIIAMCKGAGVRVQDVENIYLNHPLFAPVSIKEKIGESLIKYAKRETGVEIGSFEFVKNNFSKFPLFHTFNHPADPLLKHLLEGVLERLGVSHEKGNEALRHIPWQDDAGKGKWSKWGFGFNSWPIITRNHKYFDFKGREEFRVAGKEVDIMSFAIASYHYYDEHPKIFEQALAMACTKKA